LRPAWVKSAKTSMLLPTSTVSRNGGLGSLGGQGADVALGLAARFEHGVIPPSCAANGGGLARAGDGTRRFERQVEVGGFGGLILKLLGFEEEGGAFVEVNASLTGRAVGVMLGYGKLEGVARARLGVGARHAEQVAKLNEEELRVGALRRARGRPARDEVLDFPARHGGLLHEAKGRRQC
jgi:hypothetical protein